MASGSIVGTITLPPGGVKNSHISNQSGDRIDPEKMGHIHNVPTNFFLESDATPAAKDAFVYQALAAGTLRSFVGGLVESGSNTDITFDLKKNGVSVLSAPVQVVHGDGDFSQVAGTIATPSFAAGDVFTAHLATTNTTGAQGPFVMACFEENGAP